MSRVSSEGFYLYYKVTLMNFDDPKLGIGVSPLYLKASWKYAKHLSVHMQQNIKLLILGSFTSLDCGYFEKFVLSMFLFLQPDLETEWYHT